MDTKAPPITNYEITTRILCELCGWKIPSGQDAIRQTGRIVSNMGIAPDTNYLQALPDLTESTDACLEHIVSAMRGLGFIPTANGAASTTAWHFHFIHVNNGHRIQGYSELTLALAICDAALKYCNYRNTAEERSL